MTTVGLFVISLILEATMPTTPGCQPSPAAQAKALFERPPRVLGHSGALQL